MAEAICAGLEDPSDICKYIMNEIDGSALKMDEKKKQEDVE